MEKPTGYRFEFEFLAVPENTQTLHGRKGKETQCVACYDADRKDMPASILRIDVLETYTETSHRYVECQSCGECISEQ